MKKTIFLIISLLYIACNSEQKNYDQMAVDLCGCMRPLADVNQKIKQLINEGKTSEAAALFEEVEKVSTKGEACANALEEKYGIVDEKGERKASAALKKHCPDIAKMLEQTEALEQ